MMSLPLRISQFVQVATLVLFLTFIPGPCAQRTKVEQQKCHKKRLLIVSFDGFRWNYLNRTETPNFDKFLHNGVHAQRGIINAFITKTFPNHYTLATGLWEESHNIVANNMFDPVLNRSFFPANQSAEKDPAWFDAGGEPIWVTNQRQGDSHSGVLMWVGNGAPVHNILPTKYIMYTPDFKNETKIDTLLKWFKEDCQMNLGMTYFRQPDFFAHKFGPDSEQVTHMIGGLDKVVGYLLRRFTEEGLLESTNLILTSDHGFASTPSNDTIHLEDYIDIEKVFMSEVSTVAVLWPRSGYLEEVYANLTSAAVMHGYFTVYKKEDIPEHYHYKTSRRIGPILLIADEHYTFVTSNDSKTRAGDHGYDNRLGDMHPFFLAMGPDFKSGYSVETFYSVDVYPLMCHLLGKEPSPNNGSMDTVSKLLKAPRVSNDTESTWMSQTYVILIVIAVVLVIVAFTYFAILIYKRYQTQDVFQLTDEFSDRDDAVLFTARGLNQPLLDGTSRK